MLSTEYVCQFGFGFSPTLINANTKSACNTFTHHVFEHINGKIRVGRYGSDENRPMSSVTWREMTHREEMDRASTSLWHFDCIQAFLNDMVDTHTHTHCSTRLSSASTLTYFDMDNSPAPRYATQQDSSEDRKAIMRSSRVASCQGNMCVIRLNNEKRQWKKNTVSKIKNRWETVRRGWRIKLDSLIWRWN